MYKIKLRYLLILFLAIILLPLNINASEITLEANKTNLTVGDELIISAKLPKKMKSYAFLATLKYDEKVFEKIYTENFSGDDELLDITYNDKNNKFGIINKSGKLEDNLFEVHLKVKENCNVGDTNIALTNITSSDGENTEFLSTKTIKVSVMRDAKDDEEIPNYKENSITEDNEKTIKNFTTKPIIIFLLVVTVLLLFIIIYIKLKFEDKKKPFYILLAIEICLIITILILLFINMNKKDVNDDGVKDYDDAQEIIEYLLDINGEKEKVDDKKVEDKKEDTKTPSAFNQDINNDGKVDIGDVGHVTQEVTEQTKVTLEEERDTKYAPKGKITLNFKATITPKNVKITKVKIDGKEYPVEISDGVYSVTLETPKESGHYKFVISDVYLSNGKEIKTKLSFEREILKDEPKVHMFDVNDEENTLTFKLLDEENTLKEGKFVIYDADGKEVYSGKLKDDNTVEYPFEEEKDYQIVVSATYDLDGSDDEENLYENKQIFSHTFKVYKDYNFTLTDVAITDIVQQGETPVVTFTSTNSRLAKVETATLNNKEYNITKVDNNYYEVELVGAPTTPGKHKVTLESVELSTLKLFYNEKDYNTNTLTYSVLKKKPSVTNIKLTSNRENKTIKANFDFVDEDETLVKLKAVLLDSTGKIVDSKTISMEEIYLSKTVELSYDKNLDGLYTVEFLADYTLGDKYKYTSTDIGKETIEVLDDIYIQNITIKSPNTKYPVKGQKKYEIIFDVYVGNSVQEHFTASKGFKNLTNYTRLSAVTINGLNYVAEGEKSTEANIYRSRISLTVPKESGIVDLKISRVQMQYASYYIKHEDFYSVPLKEMKIEVLKDIPTIDNLKVTDDYENSSATFDFDVILDEKAIDGDESFKTGTIELNGNKIDIERGHNTVKFEEIEKDRNFDVIFKGSYDLDTDTLYEDVDKNEYDKEFYRVKYGLYDSNIYDDVKLENGKVISSNNNKYFEKNEKIKLQFNITGINETLGLKPQKVVIDDKEYTLNETNDGYEVILDGYTSSGKRKVKVTDVILDNGKKVTLKDESEFTFEILKNPIEIVDYKYEVLDENIKLTFKTKDSDSSLVDKAKVKITDEDNNIVFESDYADEITFKYNDGVRYYVSVIADYDRDTDKNVNSDNYYDDIKLLEEIISLDENNIELKDITEINLYKAVITPDNEETILFDEVNKEELEENLEDYFIEINMENLPSTRARIKNVTVEDNHLILVLDYKYVTKENSNKTKTIRIDYGVLENGVAKNETHPEQAVKSLLERLEKNEDVTLNQNYDFSYAKSSGTTYIDNYTGHLDGNGYTIKNLDKPLFETISNGEVKNLNIINISFGATGKGALANTVTGSTIKDVLIDKVTRTGNAGSESSVGGFIGAVTNSKIDSCRVSGVVLSLNWLAQNSGLFVGTSTGTEITDCYAEGKLQGGWNFTSGFVGSAYTSQIKNNYLKVISSGHTEGPATSFGSAYNKSTSSYENNVCIATGTSNNFASSYKELKNNYFYLASNTQDKTDGVINITKEEINNDLFKKANFDEKIWRLKDVSYDNLPTLQIENKSVLNDTSSDEYNEENETLYKNLTKLMPFYDSNEIIEKARNITDTNLKTKEIVHILPVDTNGEIVSYLTTEDVRKISKIKIVYKTKEKAEYNVIYDNTYDMVVNYRIPQLKIDYNYSHYAINTNSQVVNNLTNYLKNLTYTNNLDILTASDDSRIYRDYYNDVTSKELKEFVLKFLSNSNYTNTTDDEGINNYIEREVKQDKKIEKTLYMYNYFKRWYTLDIDGMDLSDFMLFNMQGFDKSLTPIEITNLFFKSDSNFNTGETNTKYSEVLSKYTKLDTLAKFLEYMVQEFSDEQDMSNWVRNQFKGYLVEIPVEENSEVLYTLWDHFSHEDAAYHNPYRVYNFILPILTLPENAAYIVSSPVQFVIGAQRTYISNPEDPAQHETLVNKIKTRTDRMINYYATAYGILGDVELFNNIHTYHTDKRYTYDENGVQIYQQKGSTEEPFHKNFNEVVGQWAHSDGNNAVSWGYSIDWSVAGFLDGELRTDGTPDPGHTPYNTWSHESAHNIDARLFLRNNGRRYDGHGEDYADSNLTQGFNRNDIVMNLSINFNSDQQVGSNLRPDRINSQEKVWSFYSGVFDSIYVMDYLEALAFLELSPEDQAQVAVQVSYPDEEKYINGADKEKYLARRSSRYTELTTKDFEDMHLETIDDLIEHKIMIQPGIYKVSTRGVSQYGGEGLSAVHWYQPNNPYGRPDSYSLKWLAYEMLGYKGYDNGYIEYYSNINPTTLENIENYKTDNMAIKKISNGEFDNFDEYKVARFKEVKEKLDRLNNQVNVKEYVQKFYEELKRDAEFERTSLKKLFENQTEEQCLNYYWCLHGDLAKAIAIPYSSEVRYEIYYKLKSITNEFTSKIYADSHQQDTNITINKD